MNRRNALKNIACYAGLTGATALFSACSSERASFTAIDLTGADYARDFKLADFNGRTRTLADFRGQLVMVFFGYTQCPDVCPTTLSEMVAIKRLLGADSTRLQPIFVTLDPERDRAEMLKTYLSSFDASFLALRPTPAELPELAKAFKVYYKIVPGPTPTSYTLDHTAGCYVYDTQGRLRLFTRYGTAPEKTAADLRVLLQQAG